MPNQNIIQKPSPNFWQGRDGYKPEAVVVHIMDGTLAGTDSHFASPATEVSAHYGIGQSGETHQYVNEENSAWHAGRVNSPTWSLLKAGVNPNHYTIGVEHEGNAGSAWSAAMKLASATLIADICKRWSIPTDRGHIIGHYQIDGVRRPNCPAYDKRIIDEIVALAKLQAQPKLPPEVEDGIKKIEEGLALIKRAAH